jgi:hypothetical protein
LRHILVLKPKKAVVYVILVTAGVWSFSKHAVLQWLGQGYKHLRMSVLRIFGRQSGKKDQSFRLNTIWQLYGFFNLGLFLI